MATKPPNNYKPIQVLMVNTSNIGQIIFYWPKMAKVLGMVNTLKNGQILSQALKHPQIMVSSARVAATACIFCAHLSLHRHKANISEKIWPPLFPRIMLDFYPN